MHVGKMHPSEKTQITLEEKAKDRQALKESTEELCGSFNKMLETSRVVVTGVKDVNDKWFETFGHSFDTLGANILRQHTSISGAALTNLPPMVKHEEEHEEEQEEEEEEEEEGLFKANAVNEEDLERKEKEQELEATTKELQV